MLPDTNFTMIGNIIAQKLFRVILFLVCQRVFGSDYKITDRWEIPVDKVLEKHGNGPVFVVQRIGPGGDNTIKNLHCNMLYPFISLMGEEGKN